MSKQMRTHCYVFYIPTLCGASQQSYDMAKRTIMWLIIIRNLSTLAKLSGDFCLRRKPDAIPGGCEKAIESCDGAPSQGDSAPPG